MKKYFLVQNPKERVPAKKCATFIQAQKEAKRLASREVGETFIVLEAITGFKSESTEPSIIQLENPNLYPEFWRKR